MILRKLHTKSILVLTLVIGIMLMSLTSVTAATKPIANPIRVFVQDKEIKPTNAPVIKEGRVYVEFRSVVQALGFNFKYDANKKLITADSEDASFKIDLKTGATYVNGKRFRFGLNTPMIIDSGVNTLVMTHMFNPTDYITAEYRSDKNIIEVYESQWGKPKKSDSVAIRSVIEKHFKTVSSSSLITDYKMVSWGTYVTISVDVAIQKSGNELLDRIEHTTIEMNRENDNSWTIHNIQTETDYLGYSSLSQKEVAVPEADKSAILAMLEANIKALNEENAEELIKLLNPDEPLNVGISSKEELQLIMEYTFLKEDLEYKLEQSTIVSYEPNKAILYTISTLGERNNSSAQSHLRTYALTTVVKASDGKWHLNSDNDIMLDYETF